MPRALLNDWLAAVMSEHGPKPERLRHVCHVLAYHIRGDGTGGCYPSQRTVARALGVDHKTSADRLRKLQENGWLDVTEVPRQFGRTGHHYWLAIPEDVKTKIGEPKTSPIRSRNGEPRPPQSASGKRIGEFRPAIGEFASVIGEPRNSPESLTEISTEGAASPRPADAGSAAVEVEPEKRRKIVDLQRRGCTLEFIADSLKISGVTREEVLRVTGARG